MNDFIYLIYGEEPYWIEERLNDLIGKWVDPAWREVDLITFDATKSTIQEAVAEAEMLPFGADHKVVVVKNAYFLTGTVLRGGVEHDPEVLKAYMDHPTPSTILILVAPYPKLDERKKIVKNLIKTAQTLNAKAFSEKERWEWLRGELKKREITFSEETFQYMTYLLPKTLLEAHQELEKLSLYAAGGKKIEKEDLEKLLTRTVEGDIFTLIDKALHQDVEGAFTLYDELRKRNEEPIKLLSLFGRQIRLMIEAKSLSGDGFSQKEIATRLKIHPYSAKMALELGRTIPMEKLILALSFIAEIDFKMKQGLVDKGFGMELVLLKLQELRKKTTA